MQKRKFDILFEEIINDFHSSNKTIPEELEHKADIVVDKFKKLIDDMSLSTEKSNVKADLQHVIGYVYNALRFARESDSKMWFDLAKIENLSINLTSSVEFGDPINLGKFKEQFINLSCDITEVCKEFAEYIGGPNRFDFLNRN